MSNIFASYECLRTWGKRLVEGMKIFGQIIAIQPLALIVSLPSQLFGHVPITHISSQLTKQLEVMDEDNEEPIEQDDDEARPRRPPELFEIFRVGQYVRAVVTAVRPAGTSARDVIGLRRKMDETERACQRVELSLVPEQVNMGVSKDDLKKGFVRLSVSGVIVISTNLLTLRYFRLQFNLSKIMDTSLISVCLRLPALCPSRTLIMKPIRTSYQRATLLLVVSPRYLKMGERATCPWTQSCYLRPL